VNIDINAAETCVINMPIESTGPTVKMDEQCSSEISHIRSG
jgi:hypothetical protein